MIIENNKTFSNLIIPFSFPCSKGDFAKVQKKIVRTKLWSPERCKANYLTRPVISMIDEGRTAACFLAHREQLVQFGITKNTGTRYFTAADRTAGNFRIGNIYMYIFDSGVGVVIIEMPDCSDNRIPHKLQRIGGNAFNCYYTASKEDFTKVDISGSLRNALDALLSFSGTETFFSSGGNCGRAMIFSYHKTDRELTEEEVRGLLVDQLFGSGTRDAAVANFDTTHCIHPYPGAYWYVAPEGVACLLATAESPTVTNMESRMTTDYIVTAVLALHRKLSIEKLFGGKTGEEMDDKTAASVRKFSDERTFARIADDTYRYCQELYELSGKVFVASVPAAKPNAGKKAGKIVLSVGLVSAIIATVIGGVSNLLDISEIIQNIFGVTQSVGMLISYGVIGFSLLLEIIALVANSRRDIE